VTVIHVTASSDVGRVGCLSAIAPCCSVVGRTLLVDCRFTSKMVREVGIHRVFKFANLPLESKHHGEIHGYNNAKQTNTTG